MGNDGRNGSKLQQLSRGTAKESICQLMLSEAITWMKFCTRVSYSSLESRAHTPSSIKQDRKANKSLFSVEETGNLLGFALRSDLLNLVRRGKIEVNA